MVLLARSASRMKASGVIPKGGGRVTRVRKISLVSMRRFLGRIVAEVGYAVSWLLGEMLWDCGAIFVLSSF